MTAAAEPLVLLPGMNCSSRLWADCAPGPAITPELTESDLDRQVDRLLDELPGRFALAGLSLGGIVAMALIRRAPERVTRLALLATNARAPIPGQYAGWRAMRGRLASGVTAREIQAGLIDVLLGPTARRSASAAELTGRTLAMADEVGHRRLDAQLQLQATRIDERPGLLQVTVPTLAIGGTEDALCPPAYAAEIAGVVPGAELIMVPDTGHLAPLERPAAVGRQLRRWRGTPTDQGVSPWHRGGPGSGPSGCG